MKINGQNFDNEEELHELLELDYIDYDTYMKCLEDLDNLNKFGKIESKRKSYKKLYLEAMERINLLEHDIEEKFKLIQQYESVLTFDQVKSLKNIEKIKFKKY